MFVENIMIKKVITLRPDSTISEAMVLMQKNRIRHLPVVDDNNQILGIISDRDVRDASPSVLLPETDNSYLRLSVSKIMTQDLITGSPLDFIEDVAATFYEYKISCLPITNQDKLLGIVTESDLLRSFVELTGAGQPGSRLEIQVDHTPGSLGKISTIISARNINILSVFIYPAKDEDHRLLVFRLKIMNPMELALDLREQGFDVVWPIL
ncbi:acetoin utilization AcuB family protein [Alkalibacter rhizosphaerae]|uniref:Acetoin utilization AcuB family protein n=1 Tax=Alkalibacter rhizosphaerae TaxID=2815577 RepID=A0A974XG09_9FIRM|nr:acetoin utilization AcuB family protein [Alkalibacter rhizosphaerae]QSX09071.1 acetoin utilization AcuB family protein [Alkalibacter rhizosphaerae]